MTNNALNYKLHSANNLEVVNHSNKEDLGTKGFEEFCNANVLTTTDWRNCKIFPKTNDLKEQMRFRNSNI